MQQADPRNWWWKSFFITYVSQQPMLVGVCLPLWAINFDGAKTPFGPLDFLATILCIAGLMIAYFADTQLREFMLENEARVAGGKEPIPLLYRGLWKYSRHPNYFFNSIVMWQVTVMTEQKMVEKPSRREAYVAYQKATSVWVPLPPGHLDPKYCTPDSDKSKKEK
jgi:steroid 5-alpha reductase family enzyme